MEAVQSSALLVICEATYAELWSASEQTAKQTNETPVIWDDIAPLWRHCTVITVFSNSKIYF